MAAHDGLTQSSRTLDGSFLLAAAGRRGLRLAEDATAAHRPRREAHLPPEAAPAVCVAWLTERFPGVSIWFGRHTGRFWALVRPGGRPRLVGAVTAQELVTAITQAGGCPWP
jgi:hypothetical protein